MRHRTKFREDWSNRSEDMADFRFFRMAAAAILDFKIFKFLTVGTVKRSTSSEAVERWQDGGRIKQVQLDEEDVDVTADDVIAYVTRELCVYPARITDTFTHSACPPSPSHTHTHTK